jgi:hypothetical protein
MNPAAHLPKMGKLIIDVADLKKRLDRKEEDDVAFQKNMSTKASDSYDILKVLKFDVSIMSGDLDFMKKVFNNDKIKMMNA